MTDESIYLQLDKLKKDIRKNSILVIGIAVAVLFIAGSLLFTRGNKNDVIRNLEKENKLLHRKKDSRNTRYTKDSLEKVLIETDIEIEREERRAMQETIRSFSVQLQKFKQQYAKVSNYKNVPVDSLTRVFSERFDY